MTSTAILQRKLRDVPFDVQAYVNIVEQLILEYHGDQLRDDGAPYTNHVRDVMRQIMDVELECRGIIDWVTVMAGGCHDLIEDSYKKPIPVTDELIARAFGQRDSHFGFQVAWLVKAVSKEPRENFRSKEERLAEYYSRLLVSAKLDYRVLLIKYADRNHSLATLHGLVTTDTPKVRRIAQETMDFYVPLGEGEALEILPECYHVAFGRMVERMKRLALAYLPDDYNVSYNKIIHKSN